MVTKQRLLEEKIKKLEAEYKETIDFLSDLSNRLSNDVPENSKVVTPEERAVMYKTLVFWEKKKYEDYCSLNIHKAKLRLLKSQNFTENVGR